MNNEELLRRHASTMSYIERMVADCRCYVPKQVADRREALESEMTKRGLIPKQS